MITVEKIARAICKYGTCKTCDEDCADYRAAQRVMKAIEEEDSRSTETVKET
jgi:hypothetical protein